MPDILAARSQMAMSLAFHIIFAVVGVGMPALMVAAERRWLTTGDSLYLDLAKRWAKGTAILFAVGAVSGTVLSFELGLLWPRFMEFSGAIVGLPFALEGFAFFTEAIFLGVYLYGWDRIPPRAHLAAGALVALSGTLSAIFVVIANAWMNSPAGLDVVDGRPANVSPLRAMANPATFPETLHMTLAAFAATGLAVAGIHAFLLLRLRAAGRHDAPGMHGAIAAFHRRALSIALLVGAPAAILQPISGDVSARFVARWQPVKLASMEGQFATERGAPLRLGGWPDVEARETPWAIEIPRALSLLAFHDPNAVVRGLDEFPRDDWPPVRVVHVAFQIMVASGTAMALVALWAAWTAWRARRRVGARVDAVDAADGAWRGASPWLLRALVLVAPLGFVAVEAGWTVTEVGRQPWIVYGLLRTADAVTPVPGLVVPFISFTLLYCLLGVIVVVLLYRQIVRTGARSRPGGAGPGPESRPDAPRDVPRSATPEAPLPTPRSRA
ncbi:MAG: cytochrome ubiquinol oxidase subunit I [Gemmatimonadaceae bacterium]